MPKFAFTGIAPDGTTVTGTTRAATPGAARTALMERDVVPVSVEERASKLNIELTKAKVNSADLMQFSRQLAAFLRAGIPILDGIQILLDETGDKALRKVLADVVVSLRGGEPLSAAVGAHRGRFPAFYVEMLRASEVTGSVDEVLDQLAEYLERDLEAARKIKSALAYPSVILVMSIVTVGILTAFVLPRFQVFFTSLNAELPLPTRMLLAMTNFLTEWWWALLGGLVSVVGGGYLFVKTRFGRALRDRTLLRLPVVGVIIRYVIVERVSRMLASMVRAGVPLPRALDLVADSTRNAGFERGLRDVRNQMIEGEGLSRPLARTGLFPTAVTQMIRVGEDTGSLEQQLELAATFYDRELNFKIKRLTTLFEPAVILFMGGIVGFVAVALISAMYGIFTQGGVR